MLMIPWEMIMNNAIIVVCPPIVSKSSIIDSKNIRTRTDSSKELN